MRIVVVPLACAVALSAVLAGASSRADARDVPADVQRGLRADFGVHLRPPLAPDFSGAVPLAAAISASSAEEPDGAYLVRFRREGPPQVRTERLAWLLVTRDVVVPSFGPGPACEYDATAASFVDARSGRWLFASMVPEVDTRLRCARGEG